MTKVLKDKAKKIVAIAIMATMIIGAVAGGLGTIDASAQTETEKATMVLSSMSIISADSNGNYNLENTITRGEFAKMIVMASPYKDQVNLVATSAPFKDVDSSHWASPYITVAASNGLLYGYSDGTFRPDNSITLEQAVNSALMLLGYTSSDFQGAFPHGQINTYKSNGLSTNINKTTGSTITKGDAANLIYNLLNVSIKDGSKKYGETLGYTFNTSGEINYTSLLDENMYGPYTVQSASWQSDLGVNSSSVSIYKNGSIIGTDQVEMYDIIYYSSDKNTLWAYDDKITGVLESASPSQNAPTSITVSGKAYTIESTAAFTAVSSGGDIKIGEGVTVLLGKNGGAANVISTKEYSEETVLYVTETGTKAFVDSNNNNYTSYYIKGVMPTGAEIEYAIDETWVEEGEMVTVEVEDGGNLDVTSAQGGKISGEVEADILKIGSNEISPSATIMDTYLGSYAMINLARIDGLDIDTDDVLYYSASNGKVTTLVLDNVSGDSLDYGVVTSVSQNDGGGSSMSLSGSYAYDINGVEQTLKTTDKIINVSKGPAAFYETNGELSIRNLSKVSGVDEETTAYIIANGTTYYISENVKVYEETSGEYRLSTIEDALEDGNAIYYYDFDKSASTGAKIRVIVY